MTLAVSTYQWYLMVHVLMAVVWVGGAHMIQLFASRIVKGGDPVRLAGLAKDAAWVGSHIFAQRVAEVALMRSDLSPNGARYTVRSSATLIGAGNPSPRSG